MAKNLGLTDSVTIANGATTSSSFGLTRGRVPLAVLTPASLTGTSFTFQASLDGVNFYDLYNGSSAYSVTVGSSRYIALNPDVFQAVQYVRIVSGSAETGAKTIYIVSGEL